MNKLLFCLIALAMSVSVAQAAPISFSFDSSPSGQKNVELIGSQTYRVRIPTKPPGYSERIPRTVLI